jgi:hypothetical protein
LSIPNYLLYMKVDYGARLGIQRLAFNGGNGSTITKQSPDRKRLLPVHSRQTRT